MTAFHNTTLSDNPRDLCQNKTYDYDWLYVGVIPQRTTV